MNILENLIASLDTQSPVYDIRQGIFHTAVVTRHCGLAATLPKDAMRQKPPLMRRPGTLLDLSALELARLAMSDRILEAAVGMAAINSLLDVDEEMCIELNAAELIIEKGAGKRVAIVGHFPFVPRVKEKAAQLWVIEKNPTADDLDEHAASEVIPRADVVAVTGTALTNHTLEGLLTLCRPDSFVVMLGDTVPITPLLFELGVDALSGTRVADTEAVLRCVSQGANFRQIKGIRKLTMIKR
ncbi:MAG TPA: hypothetical protein ENN08_00505 [Bacteroidales bacterium]|nr:hypothetical protein [Bacteroidales bacterium]